MKSDRESAQSQMTSNINATAELQSDEYISFHLGVNVCLITHQNTQAHRLIVIVSVSVTQKMIQQYSAVRH